MGFGTILPLVLLVLLVIVLLLLARRAASALAVTRAAAAFQGEVSALGARVLPVVEELVRRVDAVRRHQLPADEVRETLGNAQAAFEQEREAIAGWLPPPELGGLVTDLADDIDRFARAVETIDFGTQLVVTGTSRQRELEAQTAIKRGYLNLLHARQSFNDHIELIARRAEASTRGRASSRA